MKIKKRSQVLLIAKDYSVTVCGDIPISVTACDQNIVTRRLFQYTTRKR